MSKKNGIVEMYNWTISKSSDGYNLSGVAKHHPKLGKNACVAYTSSLESGYIKDDILYYHTRNTDYECPLKYMRIKSVYFGYSLEELEEIKKSCSGTDNQLDEIIYASIEIATNDIKSDLATKILELNEIGQQELKEAKEAENNRLIKAVEQYENAIYLEVCSISTGDLLAYKIKDKVGVIEPSVHVGMTQDSVLYMEMGVVDFRYFPMGTSMETYSWSDTIDIAVIKNCKQYEIRFNNEVIKPNEVRVFDNKSHKQGLISGDCVTGKSILG